MQELTGSPVAANKRIGMFGGASCLSVPTSALACDGAHVYVIGVPAGPPWTPLPPTTATFGSMVTSVPSSSATIASR